MQFHCKGQSGDKKRTGKHEVYFLIGEKRERVSFLKWIEVHSCLTVCNISSQKPLMDYLMGILVGSNEHKYRSMKSDIFHFQLIMFPATDKSFIHHWQGHDWKYVCCLVWHTSSMKSDSTEWSPEEQTKNDKQSLELIWEERITVTFILALSFFFFNNNFQT